MSAEISTSVESKIALVERLSGLSANEDTLNPDVIEALSGIVSDFALNFYPENIAEYADGWIARCEQQAGYASTLMTVLEKLDSIHPFHEFYQRYQEQLQPMSENDFTMALYNFYSYTDRMVYRYLIFGNFEERDVQNIRQDVKYLYRALSVSMELNGFQAEIDDVTHSATDCVKKKQQLNVIVDKLVSLFSERGIIFKKNSGRRGKAVGIDKQTILNSSLNELEFAVADEDKVESVPIIGGRALILSIRQLLFDIDFERRIGKVDEANIATLTATNGAKFANLKEIGRIKELKIPEYAGIPAEIYLKWRGGQNIDDDLQEFFEWTDDRVLF